MIISMIFAGFVSTMNLWASNCADIKFHLNDVYMVSLMICVSLLLSNLFMNKKISLVLLMYVLVIVYLIRTQIFIDDKQYLLGMIPHHSMAITMSNKIIQKTNNPKIKKLALNIIKSQQEEIQIMNNILNNQ